jgi:hypothetical protein
MLAIQRFHYSFGMAADDFDKLISVMSESGWRGLVHTADEAVREAIGLNKHDSIRDRSLMQEYFGSVGFDVGEVFYRNDTVYYLRLSGRERSLYRRGASDWSEEGQGLEVGVIGYFDLGTASCGGGEDSVRAG